MKIAKNALLRHSRIESAIDRIEEDCQSLHRDLKQLERTNRSAVAERPVLITDRVRQVRSLLERFREDKPKIKRQNKKFLQWRRGVLLTMTLLGAVMLFAGGDRGFSLVTSAGVLMAAFPLALQVMTEGTGIEKSELETRRDICRKSLHSVRAMLLVIDSHVAAKPLWRHWCPASEACDPGDDREPGQVRDGAYLDPSIAMQYLSIASSLARVCARIAALYPQVLRDHELASEADALALIAFEIERGCLMKAELIRTFGTMPAQASERPRSACRARDSAPAEQSHRQAA